MARKALVGLITQMRPFGSCTKRFARLAIDHELQVDIEIWQVKQVDDIDLRLEFLDQQEGVFWAQPERDHGTGVSEDRVADIGLQLMHVLMGQHKSDTILSQLTHHVGEHERGEVMELVEIHEEGSPRGFR